MFTNVVIEYRKVFVWKTKNINRKSSDQGSPGGDQNKFYEDVTPHTLSNSNQSSFSCFEGTKFLKWKFVGD